MLEGGPALGEQGEPALAAAAQVAQLRIPGAGTDVGLLVPCGLFHRDKDFDPGAFVAAVGEIGHSEGQAVGAHEGLDVAAVAAGLARSTSDNTAYLRYRS